jgi:Notch-like protein
MVGFIFRKNFICIFVIEGSCQNETDPCSSNGVCLQTSSTQFICQCKPEYTGVLCQISLFPLGFNIVNACQCLNGGKCLNNGTCSCPNGYMGSQCDMSMREKKR